jgi:SAM-dependent methyltransferase
LTLLVCPTDRSPLDLDPGGSRYACSRCGGGYPIEDGVVRFLEASDRFYEGRYLYTVRFLPRSESLPFAWPLWLMSSGYVWAARRHVPAGSHVLEMGCASGVAYFAQRYRVTGLDLSFSSLARVADLYETCIQADATLGLPLPDASVDAIFSSYVWEHIPPDRKPAALTECARVLRPGGKLVFLFDVESLRVLEFRGKDKLLVAPAIYDKFGQWPGGVGRFAALGASLGSGRKFHLYNALLRILDETLGRLLPASWSRVIVAVCEKR